MDSTFLFPDAPGDVAERLSFLTGNGRNTEY